MMENIDPTPPEGVGNDGGINPPPIDNFSNTPSRHNRRNKSGISRGNRGGKSKRHHETAVVAAFPAEEVDPPAYDIVHDDLHGMPKDYTKRQMGLELTAKIFKSVQNKKCYQKRKREEDKVNHAE